MMLRGLYPYGGALTRPVTIPFRNRFAHAHCRGRRVCRPVAKRQNRPSFNRVLPKIRGYGRILSAPTGCVQKCSCLNVFIDFYERIWYNIFILQAPPMHCSERNLDVRVGIMPTIHPIYRRNNLENNLQNNGINFSKQPVVFENKPTIAITKAKARATAKATAKAITKENLSSCQADKPPRERSFLFLDRMILVKRRMAVQEAFALPWVHPPSFAPGVYAHLGTG